MIENSMLVSNEPEEVICDECGGEKQIHFDNKDLMFIRITRDPCNRLGLRGVIEKIKEWKATGGYITCCTCGGTGRIINNQSV